MTKEKQGTATPCSMAHRTQFRCFSDLCKRATFPKLFFEN